MVLTNKKANHKHNSTPKLSVLPPTKEAFQQHFNKDHLLAAIWRFALNADPPDLNSVHYRWSMNADTNKLEPVALPIDVSPAPESVLRMIKCAAHRHYLVAVQAVVALLSVSHTLPSECVM